MWFAGPVPENDPNSEMRVVGGEDDTLAEIVDVIKSLARLHPDVTSISVTSGRRSIAVARTEHTTPVSWQSPIPPDASTHTEPDDNTTPSDNNDQPAPRHRRPA